MYYYWRFDIFSDLFSAFGWFFGGLIALVLALLIIALCAIVVSVFVIVITAWIAALWTWFCRFMAWALPDGAKVQGWFKEKYLNLKYPSRVRRRKNKRLVTTE